MSAKLAILFGLTAALTAGTCVSSSVVAVNINKGSACMAERSGKNAYKWAWGTAVASGLTAGLCLTGLAILIIK